MVVLAVRIVSVCALVLLVVVVVWVVAGPVAAAAAAGGGGCLASYASDVDQQGLVSSQEQRQALGHRLLADAVPAVDVD